MAESRRDVIFGQVIRVASPDETKGGFVVDFEGDRSVRLDPGDKRAAGYSAILGELQEQGRPAYLELDEDDGIHRLLVPIVAQVRRIGPAEDGRGAGEGDLQVELQVSHARHVLRRDNPDFGDVREVLRRAQESGRTLAVVSDDRHEILAAIPHDTAVSPTSPVGGSGPVDEGGRGEEPRGCLGRLLGLRRRCLRKRQAQKLFDAMASRTCAPLTVPPPCIPFLYPDDGCWGRAHEMSRLMIQTHGVTPRKVWIYGILETPTKNNPNCKVHWGWHVAPTVCVRSGCLGGTQEMVIDPSLFDKPVSKATWKSVQGDHNAVLEGSAWTVFWRSQGGASSTADPTFTKTNQVLSTYRMALQARSLNIGPPPYANC